MDQTNISIQNLLIPTESLRKIPTPALGPEETKAVRGGSLQGKAEAEPTAEHGEGGQTGPLFQIGG